MRASAFVFAATAGAAASGPARPLMQMPALPAEPPGRLPAASNASHEFVLAHAECVTPIRDQGHCGSCWAFAATGTLADRTCVRTGQRTRLSPQDLLDCERLNLGCTMGSLPQMAWGFLAKTGVADDACVPYEHARPRKRGCPARCAAGDAKAPAHLHRSGNATHYKTVEAMMAAVDEGPVDVSFNVHSDFHDHWYARTNATYVHAKGGYEGVHSVKLVGYGVGDDGVPFWTCENSWGYTGGFGFRGGAAASCSGVREQCGGYFRIVRGRNECGVESLAYAGWPAVERIE